MKRGEVWWAKLNEPAGRRPVVLISRDLAYAIRVNVTVAEITTRVRGIETEVPLGKREGLPKPCVANADNIQTIPRSLLVDRAGTLGSDKVRALDGALRLSLALDE